MCNKICDEDCAVPIRPVISIRNLLSQNPPDDLIAQNHKLIGCFAIFLVKNEILSIVRD